MKEIYFLVEGQTEELFISQVLAPWMEPYFIFCQPVVLATSKSRSGKKFKGGIANYDKCKNEILRLLENKNALVTTMFDFYGLPADFPGYATAKKKKDYLNIAKYLEEQLFADINNRNFLPYIQMHEFEALLYSSKTGFIEYLQFNPEKHKAFDKIFTQFRNPEEINDNPATAPSKRILAAFPDYNKKSDGVLISSHITLSVIMKKCPHFRQWIEQIINLNKKNTK